MKKKENRLENACYLMTKFILTALAVRIKYLFLLLCSVWQTEVGLCLSSSRSLYMSAVDGKIISMTERDIITKPNLSAV